MDIEDHLIELERRRKQGMRLLASGVWPAEVARRVGVSRQSVLRWSKRHARGGMEGLERPKRFGRPAKLDEAQRAELIKALKAGALAAGFTSELWTLPRIAMLIKERFGVQLSQPLGVADAAAVGLERAAADRPCPAARRSGDRGVEKEEVAGGKKIAARQGRIIVFIDESGLSERPCRARTWAPKGQTPVLQYSFSWKQLSVIAGVSFWRFYFRFFPGSIKSPQIVEFLKALQATIGRKMLIVWDRLQAHRSRLVKDYVEKQRGALALEYLPAYAPELNPVEYIWGYLEHHAMPNFCARDLGDLRQRASRHLRSMQRRGTLVTAFWHQAELF